MKSRRRMPGWVRGHHSLWPVNVPGQQVTFLCRSGGFLAKFIRLVNSEVGNYVELNVAVGKTFLWFYLNIPSALDWQWESAVE